MLSTNVKTTSDLMSIALQAEREAIRRYSELAEMMHATENESAATLFKRMVVEEEEHESLLLEWMAQEGIKENTSIPAVKWSDPNISTIYNDEARDPYQSTPYRALAFAVHNEEIAFRFYTHVAAHSENKRVRKYAEILAQEELGHAALLRAERRRAYHAERKSGRSEPMLDPKTVHGEADLLAAAIQIDYVIVQEIENIAEQSPEMLTLVRETRQQIKNNEDILHGQFVSENKSPGEGITINLAKIKTYNNSVRKNADTEKLKIQRVCNYCDRSFSFYDAVVQTTTDESVMLAAQKLSSSALDRIGILKSEEFCCTD